MIEDSSTTRHRPRDDQGKSPEPPSSIATGSRVQDTLRLGGGFIAVVQSTVFPLLDIPISLPALTMAGTMIAVGQAVKITREKSS